MPIVRADVPDWATETEMAALKKGLRGCIERTWARDHIWISVQGMHAEPENAAVIVTVDLRDGRGEEAQRTKALFHEVLQICGELFGTTDDSLIVLVRKFKLEECISGGKELPPLSQLTPELVAAS